MIHYGSHLNSRSKIKTEMETPSTITEFAPALCLLGFSEPPPGEQGTWAFTRPW